MIYKKKTINNVPTKIPLSNSAPVGNPIGMIISTYKKIQPRNYLYCDGSTFDETIYPGLYLYLGTNVLPDYRECAMVGAEKNTTDVFDSTEIDPATGLVGTQKHDVYTQGQFKDDQLQNHSHYTFNSNSAGTTPPAPMSYTITIGSVGYNANIIGEAKSARIGAVTRGKRKAVYYYIKAVDGVDISDEDTFLNTVKDYIDGKNSYSTDEIPTGGTWIDGKPIYRKVIDCGALPNNTTKSVNHGISNIDKVLTIRGFATSDGVSYIPLPYYLGTGIALGANATSCNITTNGNYTANTQSMVILEYTKAD